MTNHRVADAEIAALLVGVPPNEEARMRYLLTGVGETRKSIEVVESEVAEMREVCQERGLLCPGMHGCVADPAEPVPPDNGRTRYTKEKLVANFWWIVGGIFLVAIVSGLTDQVVKLIFQ